VSQFFHKGLCLVFFFGLGSSDPTRILLVAIRALACPRRRTFFPPLIRIKTVRSTIRTPPQLPPCASLSKIPFPVRGLEEYPPAARDGLSRTAAEDTLGQIAAIPLQGFFPFERSGEFSSPFPPISLQDDSAAFDGRKQPILLPRMERPAGTGDFFFFFFFSLFFFVSEASCVT